MRNLIEYMQMCVMNTSGKEQEKCVKILEVLEQKRRRMKLHDIILKVISYIAGFTFLLGASMMDSDSYIPACMVVISLVWLALFAYANKNTLKT